MRYQLKEQIALRSWWLVPYAYYRRGTRNAFGLKKEEFELLCRCDGQQELEESALLSALAERGLCAPCQGAGGLTPWQRPLACENRYFPAMNWMITGKCNYNCLHCFNAADNAPLMDEWSLAEAERLLDQARDCGINAFTITGGEPMLHRQFFEIMQGICERGMYVEELNTNGFFLDQQALDRLRSMGCLPLIKLSFDGLGHHDWLRNRQGAEADALRAIRLCRENGFQVMVQTNVHKRNLESMLPTIKRMEALGVNRMRIIRTTEAPRWVCNGGAYTLTLREYFDAMVALLARCKEELEYMELDIWQLLTFFPAQRSYRLRPVLCEAGTYRDTIPVCRGNRGMVAVAANGNVFPCHQMSGYYEQHSDSLGNVKREGLQKLLQSGRYLDEVCTTVGVLKARNQTCAACPYFPYCTGGCRAVALALTGDKLGCDPSKCLFFRERYEKKIAEALRDYHNDTPIHT